MWLSDVCYLVCMIVFGLLVFVAVVLGIMQAVIKARVWSLRRGANQRFYYYNFGPLMPIPYVMQPQYNKAMMHVAPTRIDDEPPGNVKLRYNLVED